MAYKKIKKQLKFMEDMLSKRYEVNIFGVGPFGVPCAFMKYPDSVVKDEKTHSINDLSSDYESFYWGNGSFIDEAINNLILDYERRNSEHGEQKKDKGTSINNLVNYNSRNAELPKPALDRNFNPLKPNIWFYDKGWFLHRGSIRIYKENDDICIDAFTADKKLRNTFRAKDFKNAYEAFKRMLNNIEPKKLADYVFRPEK